MCMKSTHTVNTFLEVVQQQGIQSTHENVVRKSVWVVLGMSSTATASNEIYHPFDGPSVRVTSLAVVPGSLS